MTERELWEQIRAGEDVRQNLSRLRQLLRAGGAVHPEELFGGEEAALAALLGHTDAKTRKNAALLMGECPSKAFYGPLLAAYEAESQRFVKSAYLQALQSYDCTVDAARLRRRFRELSGEPVTRETRKHTEEELRELSALLRRCAGNRGHEFRGLQNICSVVLLTNRSCRELTARQVKELDPEAEVTVFPAGVIVRTGRLHWRHQVRTYRELLFRIEGMERCPADPEEAAGTAAEARLLDFLRSCHKGEGAFAFRIELKSRMEQEKKTAFVRRMAAELERRTGWQLVNAVSGYEAELRLIENREGSCTAFVKLFTMEDGRFAYRREVTAQSMKPVNAALTAALAREYLAEGARVLDPFCGVGTMLIERHKAVRAEASYGVDCQAEAIEKARSNTRAAEQLVHYIHRDFFTFRHEHPFDEIFTEPPFALGKTDAEEIRGLYARFFRAAARLLRPGGIAVLYTRDRGYVKRFAPSEGFSAEKEIELSEKDGVWVMVLRKGQE